MRLVALSYASPAFRGYQRIWSVTARRAGFDEVRTCGRDDLDARFSAEHAEILAEPRGDGYWLWKPYLLAQTLADVDDGDIVFYCDVASQFVASVDPVLSTMDASGLDLLVLGEAFVEAHFTKRDAFVLMGCDESRYADSPQRLASFVAVRKRPWTAQLVAQYLSHCEDPRILTDESNVMGRPDHPGFVAHRHDQSVLSLLTKRHELEVPPNRFVTEGLADPAGQVLNHTRTHHQPSAVLHHLVACGVLGPQDLEELAIGP